MACRNSSLKLDRVHSSQPLLFSFVSSEHNEVLVNIHRSIRRKQLPFDGLALIHFDSHPDLSISPKLEADDVFQPYKLYNLLNESLSGISEFISPLLYAGHVDRVIWIKPPWAHQIRCGTFEFYIGKHIISKLLKVTLKEPYFVDDCCYAEQAELENMKKVKLQVINFEDFNSLCFPQQSYILDICLDFFSVQNPFQVELNKTYPTISENVTYLFLSNKEKNIEKLIINGKINLSGKNLDNSLFNQESKFCELDKTVTYLDVARAALKASSFEDSFELLKSSFKSEEVLKIHLSKLYNFLKEKDDSKREETIEEILTIGDSLDCKFLAFATIFSAASSVY